MSKNRIFENLPLPRLFSKELFYKIFFPRKIVYVEFTVKLTRHSYLSTDRLEITLQS